MSVSEERGNLEKANSKSEIKNADIINMHDSRLMAHQICVMDLRKRSA